ncbi:YfgM family protein [Propionivibrio dicarboxylicus]|uniref:Ancillary SecYEG translocon subunit n=1 Tax=Propionivibrio dicarboxylicus TaxID=83767 RepID=A0A1G8MRH0_9RHOO|nr:tetratricopeptide repeat protein [Propionivibrio dicarboxylicus]SDI70415.1 Putative negative regulator of RcsB-dependent stress response [Propionivibrio dicarboxylicus]
MAAYDLEEQEQLAEIKAWWKQHGNLLINVATAAAVAVLAWQGWNWYQRSQSGQASMIYHVLQQAVLEHDTQRVKAASGELVEKFGRTSYAPLGALTAARVMIDSGDQKSAKAQLQWAADKGKDEIRDLARLRLAALLLDEKAYDEALKQLDGSVTPAFEPRFADTRGDLLSAQGKKEDAVKAYQSALAKLGEVDKTGKGINSQSWQLQSNAIYREIIQQKLDALGGSK